VATAAADEVEVDSIAAWTIGAAVVVAASGVTIGAASEELEVTTGAAASELELVTTAAAASTVGLEELEVGSASASVEEEVVRVVP